jgi:hypothetical protein
MFPCGIFLYINYINRVVHFAECSWMAIELEVCIPNNSRIFIVCGNLIILLFNLDI